MRKFLLIGGAGYIGSHIAALLEDKNLDYVMLDNFSTGLPRRIINRQKFIFGDSSDSTLIKKLCSENEIDTVIHLAALRQARESVDFPTKYWLSNLKPLLGLVGALENSTIKNIIYSSSCSVYGNNHSVDIKSDLNPISPYGRTKLAGEMLLSDCTKEHGIKLGILRYFNVIGSDIRYPLWDETAGAIMPSISHALTEKTSIVINGKSFQTKDGTAERDYIDVRDLANAHLLIAKFIDENDENLSANVSTGIKTSLLRLIELVNEFSEIELEIQFTNAAKGDPDSISALIDESLVNIGWVPKYSVAESVSSHTDSVKKWLT
jgi:UDP-glucose 4-epimerase